MSVRWIIDFSLVNGNWVMRVRPLNKIKYFKKALKKDVLSQLWLRHNLLLRYLVRAVKPAQLFNGSESEGEASINVRAERSAVLNST